MMEMVQLSFANGESSLSVRSFEVQESLSKPFQIDIVARAPSADIDFEALIGEGAHFVLHGGIGGALAVPRTWSGLCVRCEQVRVEANGLSTYEVTIVPQLWLMGKRRNHRMFQHQSVIDIATTLLDEWKVPHRLQVSRDS